MLADIRLPDLYFPDPPALSPHAEAVQEAINAWMADHGYLKSEKALKRFKAGKFAWTTARAHPEASYDALVTVATFMSWLFMVDDWCDEESLGKDPDGLAALHAQLLDHMRHPRPAVPDDSPVIVGLIDVWARMIAPAPAGWTPRFIQTFADYCEGCVWEARNRAQDLVPSLDDYLYWRRQTSALYIFFDLTEWVEGFALPDAVHGHPVVAQLKAMANDGVAWFNDIVSLEKELRSGDVHNMVVVLKHLEGLDLQAAIDRAGALFNERMHAYLALDAEAPSFDPATDAMLARYRAGLRWWVRGNIDWSFETGRYGQARPETQPQ